VEHDIVGIGGHQAGVIAPALIDAAISSATF
jgi:hypothetical protein